MRYLKEPNSGRESVTLTVFLLGFVVCTAKLLLSGIKTNIIVFEQFSGMDYGAALSALGAIYVIRKHTKANKEDSK